jgi:hypothetical protein
MALSVPSQSKIPTNPQPGQTRLFAEKLWRYGKPFGQAAGVLLVAIGGVGNLVPVAAPRPGRLRYADDVGQGQ